MRPFLIWEGTPASRWILPCLFPVFFDGTRQRYVHRCVEGAAKRRDCPDLGGHHYVPSPPRACDHAGSSGLKTSPDAFNDDDLRKCVALLDKSLLDIASFVRDKRLRRIDKNKKKQQEEDSIK
ncbi:hypothetical protein P3S67_030740 [Capsicum chacoense]